jgi:hypothetical protein
MPIAVRAPKVEVSAEFVYVRLPGAMIAPAGSQNERRMTDLARNFLMAAMPAD